MGAVCLCIAPLVDWGFAYLADKELSMIREASPEDAVSVAKIYNHYIQNSVATFEEEEVLAEDMAQRIALVQSSGFNWLVAEDAGSIVGYAYSALWKQRASYRNTAEVTVYLAPESKSKGWGTKLYDVLFARLRENGTHVIIGSITLPNLASVALHEKFGMQKVAHFKEVGRKFDQWLDVGFWQWTAS